MNIAENLQKIKSQINKAEKTAGRNENSVKLVAVSKFHPVEEIEEAIKNGQLLFGENRVQEAVQKFTQLKEKYPDIVLHIIGQLQSNKVKNAVKISECIQSVDRLALVEEIEKQCAKINKKIDILFEFHTGEESKSGCEKEEDIEQILEMIKNGNFPHINPKGFMTMAPFTQEQSLIKKSFSMLKNLQAKMQQKFPEFELSELSMGMSNDFETAIAEGSTMVRIGTAIFGARNYQA